MKVTITHMKAPWPEGARVGAVVELPHESVPGWAEGKCTKAADDAEAQFVWTPPAAAAPGAALSAPGAAGADAQALDEAKQLLAAAEAKVAELTKERDAALAEVDKLKAEAAKAAEGAKTTAKTGGKAS